MASIRFFNYLNITNIKNAVSFIRTYRLVPTIRKIIDYIEFNQKYSSWYSDHKISCDELDAQKNHIFVKRPKISIIVPVYKTPQIFLKQMIDSVIAQSYTNWELCIADGSADPSTVYISDMIKEYQQNYKNIHYISLSANQGISGNTNAALSLASGDYIGLLDHDDILSPDALFEVVHTINKNPEVDVLYTDEDKTDISLKKYYSPYFKPDFNLDLLRSCNYITHFFVVKKELVRQIGGFSAECNGSQDYDFILKTCELATQVYHIPKVLYHWRMHPSSVAGDPQSKSYAYDAAVLALQNHLERQKENGKVRKDIQVGYYRIDYMLPASPKISIYLKECSPELKEQICQFSSYTNYEFIDSLEQISGEYVVILYRVTQICNSDWLEQMAGNCSRPYIGICSAKSFYKKNRVLEFGLTYTSDGQLHSPFYNAETGYCFLAKTQHNCSIVSPYCIMAKASIFQQYYMPSSDNSFVCNIWKLCRTLTQKQFSITLLPHVSVFCRERCPKLPALRDLIGKQDPFYNPNFSEAKMYHLK